MSEPHALLSFLDALLRRDTGPAGFDARIAIGVLDLDGEVVWWSAELSKRDRMCARFGLADVEARLVVGADEARSLLETGALPASAEHVYSDGDPAQITRVIGRLTSRASWMQSRIASVAGARHAKSRTHRR